MQYKKFHPRVPFGHELAVEYCCTQKSTDSTKRTFSSFLRSDGGPFVPWLIVVIWSVRSVKNGRHACLVSQMEELFPPPDSNLLAISQFRCCWLECRWLWIAQICLSNIIYLLQSHYLFKEWLKRASMVMFTCTTTQQSTSKKPSDKACLPCIHCWCFAAFLEAFFTHSTDSVGAGWLIVTWSLGFPSRRNLGRFAHFKWDLSCASWNLSRTSKTMDFSLLFSYIVNICVSASFVHL
jgi:hypothetical protein